MSFGERLDAAGFAYLLGGSLASSMHGEPRSTNDLDFVIDLKPSSVCRFAALLGDDFYHDLDRITIVAGKGGSFNLVHYDSAIKIDVFVVRGPAAERAFARRVSLAVLPEPAPRIWVAGPELIVLEKLRWFQMQDGASDRQWRDILGVLKGVGQDLDLAWMRAEADRDGTRALLEKACAQAGLG